jgi:hypothetical protein
MLYAFIHNLTTNVRIHLVMGVRYDIFDNTADAVDRSPNSLYNQQLDCPVCELCLMPTVLLMKIL